MATPPIRTVLITGGNGSLGSQTAYKIAQSQSGVFFLLTARKPNDANAQAVSEQLRAMGVETFEFMVVDLGNFASVRAFASTISKRVEVGKIPPIEVIINSAAYSSFIMDKQTEDGFDPVYQTNVLCPFLLSVLLLKSGFQKIEGRPQGRIINVSSESVNFGDVAFFDSWGETEARKPLSGLGVKLGLTRYGSSKLIMDVAMYTLRERLLFAGNKSINIFSLDPGGMSNSNSNLSRGSFPLILSTMQRILSFLRPIVRHVKKNLINDASVPADALSKVAFDKSTEGTDNEVYFILDDEVGLRTIGPIVKAKGGTILERIMKDAGISTEDVKVVMDD